MESPSSDLGSILAFSCPRCGHGETDEYEVIGLDMPTNWRCSSCMRVFSVLLKECLHCSAEIVAVALEESEQAADCNGNCVVCGWSEHHQCSNRK